MPLNRPPPYFSPRLAWSALLVIGLWSISPGSALAGGAPGPKIGNILKAEQAATSPSMAPPINLMKDKQVRKGERIVTGPVGRLLVGFLDGSEISVGADADITLDDLVFSPDEEKVNRFVVSIASGAFRYLSGKIGRLNAPEVVLRTPLATIGIRGTHVLAIVDENNAGCIVLLEDPRSKGKPSALTVTADGKTVIVDRPGWGTEVVGPGTAPAAPRTWPKERIVEMLKM